MDDISMNDLDSFTVEMVERVKSYKKYLDEALNDFNDDETTNKNQRNSDSSLKLNQNKPSIIDDHKISQDKKQNPEMVWEFDQDKQEKDNGDDEESPGNNSPLTESDEELMIKRCSRLNSNHVRQSIHKLLNVHEPLDLVTNNVNNTDHIPLNKTNNRNNTRLHQRLSNLAEMYKDEDDFYESKRTVVLKEQQNLNSQQDKPRIQFKERLQSIAQLYYPIKSESFANNQRTNHYEGQLLADSKSQLKVQSEDLIKSKSLAHEVCSNEITKSETINKQNSVADLKKIFEAKMNESLNDSKKEIAPELLPVFEKKRLFEKVIRDENEARAKQYRKFPAQIGYVPKWPPKKHEQDEKENEHQFSLKRMKEQDVQKIDDKLSKQTDKIEGNVENKEFEANDKMQFTIEHKEQMDEKTNQEKMAVEKNFRLINEIDLNNDQDDVEQEDGFMEITFTAIDTIKDENIDNISSFYPDLQNDNNQEGDTIHRSSTRVDLTNNFANAEVNLLAAPEKPPRLYLYREEQVEHSAIDEPPLRTISFYRREQKIRKESTDCEYAADGESAPNIPRQVIHLRQKLSDQPAKQMDREQFRTQCQEKMIALKEEISEHNRVLSQASTALNLSLSLPDVRNSESRVEAERLLLISSEKRNACLNEINQLKTMIHNTDLQLERSNEQITKATLYITNVKIPLLDEFLVSRAKGKVSSCHYFICLICNGPNVFVSELLNSNSNLSNKYLEFDFGIAITDLNDDFNVIIKLFTLELSCKDSNNAKHSKLNSPFKTIRQKFMASSSFQHKGQKDTAAFYKPTIRPQVESTEKVQPMVTSSNFKMVGYVSLTLKNVKTTANKFYRLDSECFRSVIDNYLTMNITLKASHHNSVSGYFDMKEEVTPFWNLRYFSLQGAQLEYWRFGEEKDKPMGTINLKHCINPTVELLKVEQRHLCMRANTFVLVTIDPPATSNAQKLVKGGLISKSEPKIYFISSQSKADSLEFSLALNRTIRSIRLWETDIVQPYSFDEFDRLLNSNHK